MEVETTVSEPQPVAKHLRPAVRRLAEVALGKFSTEIAAQRNLEWPATQAITQTIASKTPDIAADIAASVTSSGLSVEAICSTVIPDAARLLGDAWLDDRASFGEVTIGTAFLQSYFRRLEADFERQQHTLRNSLQMILVIPSTENHTLGGLIAASNFRRLGVSVHTAMGYSTADVAELIDEIKPQLVGVSVGSMRSVQELHELTKRIGDRPDRPACIAGGALVDEDPAALRAAEVDRVTNDAHDAVAFASAWSSEPATPVL